MPKERKAAVKPAKLDVWQKRLADSDVAWKAQMTKMDRREHLYSGDRELRALTKGDEGQKAPHIRNIVFENIESQVSSAIPSPKVTPRRKEDEALAAKIEHWLRCELDRLPFETINDQAERTVPIQGGVGFLVAWDNRKRTHDTVGEEEVAFLHPKQFAPQPGIYTGIQDMDWFIVRQPTTKENIRRRYDVNVEDEGEQEPQVRGTGDEDTADDAVTMYIGYAKNDRGGIDRYVWVNDIELEDLENYQARRVPVCAHCGRVRPLPGQVIQNRQAVVETAEQDAVEAEQDIVAAETRKQIAGRALAMQLAQDVAAGLGGGLETLAAEGAAAEPEDQQLRYDGEGPCPWCGSTNWTTKEQEYEEVTLPIANSSGLVIPGAQPEIDENGRSVMRPTKIPFYRPDVFPVVLQKSVSVYGQLLGNSDVDVIEDQQNTTNRMEKKIIDRLVKAGTRITLPAKATLRTDPVDGERWFLDSPADKAMIDVYQFSGDLQYELTYLATVYEEARQILGITDSFQGRTDPTATSGKAKEFSAAQAAGRLESKRTMKQAAYAQLFELMFKFWLAYSDEPRPISYKDNEGNTVYEEISRYDFLKQDKDGQYYWEDQFLFGCDDSAPLASNREAMWQETRMNLQTGAFGDPSSTETLILFWSKMEELHYPGAGETKKYLEKRLQQEQQRAAQAQQMQIQLQLLAMQNQQRGQQLGAVAANQSNQAPTGA
uniref:Portal protein n=1 Tax=Podoviridae sp. ctIpM11 TaxID=2825240 RepID=A0A8S5UUC4_9CAUD|nr:MAG TPA: Portal protein [Podoviridae sp. ctIpM11]